MSAYFLVLIWVGREVELGEVRSEKFTIFENTNGSIVLRQPIIQALPHIGRFERNNKLLFGLNLLIDHTHPLLSRVSAQVMNVF